MKEIYGLIAFDILMALMPFMIYVAPTLTTVTGYVIAILSGLTALVIILNDKDSEELSRIINEHKNRPIWWNFYDISSDIVLALSWALIGFYEVGFFIILTKVFIAIKIPEYFNKPKDK